MHQHSSGTRPDSKGLRSNAGVVLARPKLAQLGFRIFEFDLPVNSSQIRGKWLRNHVDHSGCCGAAEYLKLCAFQAEAIRSPLPSSELRGVGVWPSLSLFLLGATCNPPKLHPMPTNAAGKPEGRPAVQTAQLSVPIGSYSSTRGYCCSTLTR